MRRRWMGWLVVLSLLFCVVPAYAQPLEEQMPFAIDAVSAMLVDAQTGGVIWEHNADERRPVASVTKLMTILLVTEALDEGRIKRTDSVTTTKNASGMGGSQALLDADAVYPLQELYKSLIIASANDAAVALAEHMMGSEQNFVEQMNKRAQELSLKDTHYANSTGLPVQGQYTTARDVATLSRKVMEHDTFFTYSTIWMDKITHKNERITDLVNTNRLIRFYEGADGVKTGSTNEAGFCVSASAKRGGDRFIAVVLGAKTGKLRFDYASKLLNYGFDHYTVKQVMDKNQPCVTEVPVKGAQEKSVELYPQDDVFVLVKKGQEGDVAIQYEIPQVLRAPLKAGDAVANATITKNAQILQHMPLVIANDIDETTFFSRFKKIWEGWMKGN